MFGLKPTDSARCSGWSHGYLKVSDLHPRSCCRGKIPTAPHNITQVLHNPSAYDNCTIKNRELLGPFSGWLTPRAHKGEDKAEPSILFYKYARPRPCTLTSFAIDFPPMNFHQMQQDTQYAILAPNTPSRTFKQAEFGDIIQYDF